MSKSGEIWTLHPSIWWNPGKVCLWLAKKIRVNLVSSGWYILVGFRGSSSSPVWPKFRTLNSDQVRFRAIEPEPFPRARELIISTTSDTHAQVTLYNGLIGVRFPVWTSEKQLWPGVPWKGLYTPSELISDSQTSVTQCKRWGRYIRLSNSPYLWVIWKA